MSPYYVRHIDLSDNDYINTWDIYFHTFPRIYCIITSLIHYQYSGVSSAYNTSSENRSYTEH